MILFGTAGVPKSCKSKKSEDGVREVSRLGLDAMEIEFVHGVRMKPEGAEKVKRAAFETGVAITAHGPYYVNLASLEPEKARASETRVLDTARRCVQAGGEWITFHAAFYQGRPEKDVFEIVAESIGRIRRTLDGEGAKVRIDPELTGKPSQLGSVEELIELSKRIEGVSPCIDFSHLAARSAGLDNSYDSFAGCLKKIRRGLGAKALSELHMHVSGIEWTAKGEARHLRIGEGDLDWMGLLRALVDQDVSGIMVCESPAMEDDALRLKEAYHKLLAGGKG